VLENERGGWEEGMEGGGGVRRREIGSNISVGRESNGEKVYAALWLFCLQPSA
jgi:hypothetical protein